MCAKRIDVPLLCKIHLCVEGPYATLLKCVLRMKFCRSLLLSWREDFIPSKQRLQERSSVKGRESSLYLVSSLPASQERQGLILKVNR